MMICTTLIPIYNPKILHIYFYSKINCLHCFDLPPKTHYDLDLGANDITKASSLTVLYCSTQRFIDVLASLNVYS